MVFYTMLSSLALLTVASQMAGEPVDSSAVEDNLAMFVVKVVEDSLVIFVVELVDNLAAENIPVAFVEDSLVRAFAVVLVDTALKETVDLHIVPVMAREDTLPMDIVG